MSSLTDELVGEVGQDDDTGHADPQGNKFDRVQLHGGQLTHGGDLVTEFVVPMRVRPDGALTLD